MRIPLAREGVPFVLVPLLVAGALFAAGWPLAALPFALAAVACLGFFRDPERAPDPDELARCGGENCVALAPADGKVTRVEPEGGGTRISIFLSVLDVHVNRSPLPGRVEGVEHRPGRYLNAMNERASQENERNEVRLETPRGPVVVTQIAGLIARRIVCRARPGDRLALGERFGLIRFGSRTDLLLPPGAESAVAPGDRVAGGRTIVARWGARP